MSQLDASAENFQAKFEQFLINCDDAEQGSMWNREKYGEMQDYYAGLIVSMILRIVTSEGWISDEDIEYLNLLFGFSYDGGELEQVFEGCRELVTSSNFENQLRNSAIVLQRIKEDLYQEFRQMVALIVDAFSHSEDFITEPQKEEILRLQGIIDTI